jgi:hypothetical protein
VTRRNLLPASLAAALSLALSLTPDIADSLGPPDDCGPAPTEGVTTMTLETLQAELVAHRAALNRTMAAVMDAYPLGTPMPAGLLNAMCEVREARQRVVMSDCGKETAGFSRRRNCRLLKGC